MEKERNGSPKRPEAVAGILLTAGLSSRMGTLKPLLPWGSRTLIEVVLEQILQSRLSQVLLVLGYQAEQIKKQVAPFRLHPKLRILENPDHRKGMSTSIRVGLDSVDAGASGVMFLLGDQPLVTFRVIDRLIRVFQSTSALIVAPLYGRRRGNPVIFRTSLIPELKKLTGDTGGRELIGKYQEQIRLVPIRPQRIGSDVDTWEDYRRLLAAGSKQPES